MRPQLFTAENLAFPRIGRSSIAGFNEAAALHCGKRRNKSFCKLYNSASMRPQLFTAENVGDDRVCMTALMRFNEAAALHCGKLGYGPCGYRFLDRLQ